MLPAPFSIGIISVFTIEPVAFKTVIVTLPVAVLFTLTVTITFSP